jgi:tRNA(Phe) wybutosine-synthesizing methylase Tyw3
MSTAQFEPSGFDSTRRKRIHFDPTVNLGHILTFVGFMVAGFGAWGNIDKRMTLGEEKAAVAAERANEQERRMSEAMRELKADVKDVQRAVNDINRSLAAPDRK